MDQQSKTMKIEIRDARKEEARFVGRCLLAAMEIMGLEENEDENPELADSVTKGCESDHELYSYRRARIAECDGKAVGCLISYNGKDYKALREVTFGRLLTENGLDLTKNPQETQPGEYYLDCMAIVPEYRGRGIGHLLMKDGMERGAREGVERITLLVDPKHEHLAKYYQELGFEKIEEMEAFDTLYDKLGFTIK